jgi:hypothetical protein
MDGSWQQSITLIRCKGRISSMSVSLGSCNKKNMSFQIDCAFPLISISEGGCIHEAAAGAGRHGDVSGCPPVSPRSLIGNLPWSSGNFRQRCKTRALPFPSRFFEVCFHFFTQPLLSLPAHTTVVIYLPPLDLPPLSRTLLLPSHPLTNCTQVPQGNISSTLNETTRPQSCLAAQGR